MQADQKEQKKQIEEYREEIKKPITTDESDDVGSEAFVTLDSITKHQVIDDTPGVATYEISLKDLVKKNK